MKFLFQNPKAALAYVGLTVVSVYLFIGTEDDPGTLHNTMDTLSAGGTAQDRAAARKFGDPPASEDTIGGNRSRSSRDDDEDETIVEFLSDEELVDSAEGFNPNPSDDFGGFKARPSSERPFLSEQDSADGGESFGGWAGEE